MKSDALTTDAPTDEHSSFISSIKREKEYLREENRAKALIIKQQLTEIKTTVNPTNTLVTYNENSTNMTAQNCGNVIDKTIQNNNKEHFKNKKNTSKSFTSTCFKHPKNKKNASANRKNTSEANE